MLKCYQHIFLCFAILLMYDNMTDCVSFFFLSFCSWGYYALYRKIGHCFTIFSSLYIAVFLSFDESITVSDVTTRLMLDGI